MCYSLVHSLHQDMPIVQLAPSELNSPIVLANGEAVSALKPSVLILGAGGRFCSAAIVAFAKAGWRVRAQTRKARADWPIGVEAVVVDAMQSDALCCVAQGVDVVVNGINPLYTEWERLARPLAANALAAATAAKALLMFPGNVYNFSSALPAELLPDTPQVGNFSKARIRIEIEEQMRAAAAEGTNSVVVRAGEFFGGTGRGAWFDRVIVKSLGQGKIVYPGPSNVTHAWAYLPDLAETFVRLAERREQLSGASCFHFNGDGITGIELHKALEKVSGRSLRLRPLQWLPIRLAAPFVPMARAILEMQFLWRRPHTLNGDGLKQLLGEVPRTPLTLALAAALRDLDLPVIETAAVGIGA